MNEQKKNSKRYRARVTVTMPPEISEILENYCSDVKANTSQVCYIALCNFLMMSSHITNEEKSKINEILTTNDKRQKHNPNKAGTIITLRLKDLLKSLNQIQDLFLIRDFEQDEDLEGIE